MLAFCSLHWKLTLVASSEPTKEKVAPRWEKVSGTVTFVMLEYGAMVSTVKTR